jgi:hypothetical protein
MGTCLRRHSAALVPVLLVLAWLSLTAVPVSAECMGPTDPWPSFRSAAPSAEQVIVGEVLPPNDASGSTGSLAVFQLRVTNVLRGPAPPGGVVDIVGLKSGLPLTICADTVVTLLPGDVVALALNATAADGATRINTLAYLRKAGESDLVGVEDITIDDAIALTSTDEQPGSFTITNWAVLGALGLLIAAAGGFLLRRRGSST